MGGHCHAAFAQRYGAREERCSGRYAPRKRAVGFAHGASLAEGVAEIDVLGVEAHTGENRGAVGPYFLYREAFRRNELGCACAGHGLVSGADCPRQFGFGSSAERLVVDVHPFGIDFHYRISIIAVAHVECACHGSGEIAAAAFPAGVVCAPGVVVAVDVAYYGEVFEYGEVVGAVIEVVEQRVMVEGEHAGAICGVFLQSGSQPV